ncbi:hypothetical protein C2845_PM05G08350 [Panicum miliaceum]|uniref:DUF1618 domain-containing protein n=1 Tax=Panicum miliaceum TaxID=4540 RepID=A0A3L6SUI4_PANMI|nr:hypothetical protein C2845_PM05G08350 [Panicum miliaceum]
MAAAGECASSWVPPPLPDCGDAPGSVLLDLRCYTADLRNATTAAGFTGRGLPIQVTFRAARPPALSHLCVHCPGAGADFPPPPPPPPPRLGAFSTHAGLLLLRVPAGPAALSCATTRYWDYFVYRAHPPRTSTTPRPPSSAAAGYVVAALRNRLPRRDPRGGALIVTEFDLHLYRSSHADEGWVTKWLAVEEPVRDALVPLPRAVADDMLYHETAKTVAVGGERGTVAWVDLWRGVILCDVLHERPSLRDVPLPLPARGNWDRLLQECNPSYIRDVTVSRDKGSIKYVEMEIRPSRVVKVIPDSYLEWVRGGGSSKIIRGGWKATAWSMPIPVGSWEDWRRECDVDVDDLIVDASDKPLLSNLQGGDTEGILRSLSVAYPTISMDDDAVYLLSKVDNLEVVVAVDVRKKTLRGVGELDREKSFVFMPSYCSSEISSYLKKTSD